VTDDRELAERAVRAGAAAVLTLGRDALDVEAKTSAADLVSSADRASEEAIVALLAAERPGDAVVGEEGARRDPTRPGPRRWLVDGLDGTVNYVRGIPQWCVAIALEDGGEPLACAVYDPSRDELFSAARGEGARIEHARGGAAGWEEARIEHARGGAADREEPCGEPAPRHSAPLRVRAGAPLAGAVVSSFLRADKLRGAPAAPAFGPLVAAPAVLRMGGAGSLELAWLAAGRLDAWAQPNVDPWDWVPGRLLVEEAGGRTAVLEGDPLTWHVAAAPGTFPELEALLRR
jgi:myo-inositol-1(or 4)-monophosphatase